MNTLLNNLITNCGDIYYEQNDNDEPLPKQNKLESDEEKNLSDASDDESKIFRSAIIITIFVIKII